MKKFSAKRVFAIIGIVFGSATAFVGVVLGVMAAMGKFKTPVVYPTELEFLNNNQIVIEKETYDSSLPEGDILFDIYSFELQGKNPSSEHDVNKKTCYIWFYNNVGSNLITLCDKNGNPLTKDENNRYKVQCNEPIYYMINEIADDAETDGKVMIMARSENNKAQVDVPLTFWIDRAVERVLLDTTITSSTPTTESQIVTVGVDIGFDFKYKVETPLSFNPISNESAKEIELYYVATGYSTDYIKVTEEEINNVNSPLNAIMTCEEGVFKFKSSTSGQHTFKIAIFPTYQSKLDYEASLEGTTIDNPNYHRVNSMTFTTLTVNVENIDVSEAGFMGTGVVLNLYSRDDYITLDGTSGVENAKDNNLELYMKKGEGSNSVSDYTRFDEVTMNGFVYADETRIPEFVAETSNGVVSWFYEGNHAGMNIELTKIHLGENLQLIDYLYQSSDTEKIDRYYCVNGAAVYNTQTQKIQLLKAGSYLNFYVENSENNTTKKIDFNHDARESGSGQEKSWNIIAKEIPSIDAENEKLVLGILVVNNKGEFKFGQFFDTIPVSVNEIPFDYEILQKSTDLDITFKTGEVVEYGEISFDALVQINSGSYGASVLVTELREDNKYIVDTINSITFEVEDKTYVLVGYVDNDQFVNSVRINGNVSSDNNSCELFVLQLKNGYEESTDDIINPLLTTGANFTKNDAIIRQLYNEDSITINSKYILNEELLNFTFYDVYASAGLDNKETPKREDKYTVFENTTKHKIVIGSSNTQMLSKIIAFYNVNKDNFEVGYYDNNLIIDSVTATDGGELIIEYSAGSCLSDENTVITITFKSVGATVNLPGILILNGSPNAIVLNTGALNGGTAESKQITLSNDINNIQEKLNIVVQYVNGEYTYLVKYGNDTIDAGLNIFNLEISKPEELGFQGSEDKGQVLEVKYSSENTSIFNTSKLIVDNQLQTTNLVEQTGTAKLTVEIGDTSNFIFVETSAVGFELTTTDNKTSFDEKTTEENLSDLATLTYNASDISLSLENLVFVENVKCISYGDGTLVVNGDRENGYTLDKQTGTDTFETILTIKDEGTGWKFKKANSYISLTITFDIVTIAGTKSITYTFSSNVDIAVGNNWENNRVFYAGTKVVLHSTAEGYVSVFECEDNDISFKINGNSVAKEFNVLETYIGDISIEVYLGETKLHTFTDFKVKPNFLVEVKKENDKNKILTSETDYEISEIYNISSYKTDIAYGSSETNLYTTSNLTTAETKDLSVKFDGNNNSNPTLTWSSTLKVGEMKELGVEKTRNLHLYYTYNSNDYLVQTDEIKITNKHIISDNSEREFSALKEYESFITVAGFDLISLSADNLTFEISDNKFIITTPIVEELKNVELTLTFKNLDMQELTYVTQVIILPYTPDEIKTQEVAYSGLSYDLFNARYDAGVIESDSNINSLIVTAIKDENGNDITEEIINGELSGYTKNQTNPHCEITFNEIVGEEKLVQVEYAITYSNNTSYIYLRNLTIKNRQAIEITYPESDLELISGTYKFLTGFEQDGANISGAKYSSEGIYTLSSSLEKVINYEPIMIYTDSSQIVDFSSDNIKKISRSIVENRTTANASENKDLTISLIGYQNYPGMAEYAETAKVTTANNTNQISLPQAVQGMSGTLVYKLETNSGNYKYYFIYVYCVGQKDAINSENNLQVIAYNANPLEGVQQVNIDDQTTYFNLISSLTDYSDTFKVAYDDYTSLYLYDITSTGTTVDYSDQQWKKIEEDDKVLMNNHFNTITIGLLYKESVKIYVYGTITIYVQPTNGITLNSTLDYVVPNGYFTQTVDANATEIASPFNSTTNIEVQTLGIEEIVSVDGTTIKIGKRVETDLIFTVKYTLNETIAFVTYTYKATTLPTNNQTITVGSFGSNNGFEKTIDLEENKEKYFGTYVGAYTLKVGNNELADGSTVNDVTRKGSELTFNQTHQQYTVNLTITYSDFNSTDNTRTFTFIVKAGIEYAENNTANSGLSSSRPAETINKEDYSSNIGSTLSLTYEEVNADDEEKKYYQFKVGGLTIYTHQASKLKLTFDKNSYVLKDGVVLDSLTDENKFIEVNNSSDSQTLNFTHSAKSQPITITIEIINLNSDVAYATRTFYITVVPTYSRLNAVYLVDGADHENVASGTELTSLHSTLLGSTRFKLLKTDGILADSPDLIKMGFVDGYNPNYINFLVGGNATISGNDTIKFNSVTTNTLCEVYLNNLAGMEENSVVYAYQIMAGKTPDGLNYSSTTGIHEETTDYISFLMNDVDNTLNYSGRFVLGSMLDELNMNNFSLLVSGEVTVSGPIKIDIDGDSSTAVGGYFHAIQYSVTSTAYSGYTFYITYDKDYNSVELIVKRELGKAIQDNIILEMSLGGVNGEKTIVENLKIVLSNYQISSEFENSSDTSIYSGYEIDLTEKILVKQGNTNLSNDETISFEMVGGTYSVEGQERNLTSSDTNNDLFKFETKRIQTKAVGADVNASVIFKVKAKIAGSTDEYVLKVVTYKFYVNLNMQFVVNGESLSENIGNSSPETHFAITLGTHSSYPIEINFDSGKEVSAPANNYYNVLVFDLYRLHIQGNEQATQDEKLMSRTNTFSVSLYSNVENGALTVDNNKITFNKDYSGELELKLSVTTDNGTYYVIWTIYVSAIRNLSYTSSNPDLSRIEKSSLPFSSGDSVNIINSATGTGVGIKMTNAEGYATDISKITGGIAAKYAYSIHTYNSSTKTMTNKQLFEDTETYYQGSVATQTKTLTSNQLQLTLPSVPATNDDIGQTTYLVTYRIYLEYLGLTYEEGIADSNQKVKVFYVSYHVINKQQVSVAKAEINVEKDLSGTEKTKLELFHFTETFNGFTFTYVTDSANGTIKVSNGTKTVDCAINSDNNQLTFEFDSTEHKYHYNTKKFYIANAEVLNGTWGGESTTNNTVFSSNFTNIVEYKNFIDKYLGQESVKLTDSKEHYFTLEHLGSGIYGIDLTENLGTGEELFNNEMKATLSIVDNNIEVITIPAWSTTDSTGFILTTGSKIEAKQEPTKLSTMFLPSYFEATEKGKTEGISLSTAVIGVGSPKEGWVNEGTADTSDKTTYATIKIPNGTGYNEYNICKVTYSASGGKSWYSISESFYYIDAENVVVPDYNAVGIESTFFKLTYIENSDYQQLDLTKAFTVWEMASGKLTDKNANLFTVLSDNIICDAEKPSFDSSVIKIATETLDTYKKQNPNKRNYPSTTAIINANGYNFLCEIVFALADYVKVSINESATEMKVDLSAQSLHYVNSSNVNTLITKSNIQFVDELNSEYVSSYDGGVVTLNHEKINTYFDENSGTEYLNITLRLTTTDNCTLDFQIVVKNV